MSQEHPHPSNPSRRLGEEMSTAHPILRLGGPLPHADGNASVLTPDRYWRLFNNLRLSPHKAGLEQPDISPEAFLNLTHQV
ncbi:hypothetical protein BHM03_00058555 [Ensete ventricosum]|nr:hypothetical protein BHM03_00058555 [Ensete ventricosum]